MSVRLGVNPIAWSNDDLRSLGGATPLETCLREARAAGFTGIELGHKFPREAGALRAVLGDHDLQLVSGWYSTNLLARDVQAEMEAIGPHLDLLSALGSDVVILAETVGAIHGELSQPIQNSPRLGNEEIRALAQRFGELAKHISGRGLKTAYHHHMGTVIETRDQIDALMSGAGDDLGLLLDTGHAQFAGADPIRLADDYRDRITHVHCKDIRADRLDRARGMSFLDAVVDGVFTVPGDGCVNYPVVLNILAAADYDGWMVVEAEQDPEKANPKDYAFLGFRNLKKYAEDAGLDIR